MLVVDAGIQNCYLDLVRVRKVGLRACFRPEDLFQVPQDRGVWRHRLDRRATALRSNGLARRRRTPSEIPGWHSGHRSHVRIGGECLVQLLAVTALLQLDEADTAVRSGLL